MSDRLYDSHNCFLFAASLNCFNKNTTVKHQAPSSELCSAMFLFNYEYPQWYHISCSDQLAVDVVCSEEMNRTNITQTLHSLSQCLSEQILFGEYCWSFHRLWQHSVQHCSVNIHSKDIPNVLIKYFSKVSESLLFFHIPLVTNFSDWYISFDSLFDNITYHSKHSVSTETFDPIIVSVCNQTREQTIENRVQVYHCLSGEIVSIAHYNNKQSACSSRVDGVAHNDNIEGRQVTDLVDSPSNKSVSPSECSSLHFKSIKGGCVTYSMLCAPSTCQISSENKSYDITIIMLDHNQTKFVDLQQWGLTDNSFLGCDCTDTDIKALTSQNYTNIPKCSQYDELPCTSGCSTCFPMFKLCVYEVDKENNILFCPSGAHVKNCEQFQCNEMFKCFQSYCIPHRSLQHFGFIMCLPYQYKNIM